jgi:hypothetical protein
MAFWLRGNLPRQADEILHSARLHYRALRSDSVVAL